jgi:multidrug efflux pump subunit AcrA (membrane-fusion protein)
MGLHFSALKLGTLLAAVALTSGATGYWLALHNADQAVSFPTASNTKVLYWYDPMVPDQHFDHPGKSPFMDMQLVPKYADAAETAPGVRIEPGVAQNLAIRFARAEQGSLSETLTLAATITQTSAVGTAQLEAALPETQTSLVRLGQAGEARLPAYPGETFAGTVAAVLPPADPASHALRLRVVLSKPDPRLRPGLSAEVRLVRQGEPALLVPSEAIIRTGRRNVVLLAESGRFRPVEVELGHEAGERSEIRRGLTAGQQVVASGQFLIDSEASLQGVLARLPDKSGDKAGEAP